MKKTTTKKQQQKTLKTGTIVLVFASGI